jgi:hypothetical protein
MALQPRLSIDVSSYLYDAINAANPSLPASLDYSNVTLGIPTPMPEPTASGINTAIVLTGVEDSGYTDAITIYYPRMDLGEQYPSGMSAVGDHVTTWSGLANTINASHRTLLTAKDFPTTPFEIDVLPASISITIVPSSLLYKGTITVSLSGSQPALSTVLTTTVLSGLNPPTASDSPTDLTQSASTLIYAMINEANPAIPNGGLSSANAVLGSPTATGATPNTSLPVGGAANQGYTGYVSVTYHRLDIQTEVSNPLIPSGLQLADDSTSPYSTVQDLLPTLNAALAINLQVSDLANGNAAIAGTTYPKAVSVVIANTCLTLVGTLAVSITQPVALGDMVTSQALNGFELPQLQ